MSRDDLLFFISEKGEKQRNKFVTFALDMNIDWTAIRNEYITTETSFRKLAEKYGVNYQSIYKRSKSENWTRYKETKRHRSITKAIEKVTEQEANKTVSIDHVADLILQAIEKDVIRLSEQGVPINWKNYSGALKDIKDVKTVEGMADSSLKIVFEGMESWDK